MLARLDGAIHRTPRAQPVSAGQLAELEPSLHGASHAWLLPQEGQIDPVGAMRSLHAEAAGVDWNWNRRVTAVEQSALLFESGSLIAPAVVRHQLTAA